MKQQTEIPLTEHELETRLAEKTREIDNLEELIRGHLEEALRLLERLGDDKL